MASVARTPMVKVCVGWFTRKAAARRACGPFRADRRAWTAAGSTISISLSCARVHDENGAASAREPRITASIVQSGIARV